MNQLREEIISNSFYYDSLFHCMCRKEQEDFVEVLGAWAKVIGVNLDREPNTLRIQKTSS